jgi:hypothetical protein
VTDPCRNKSSLKLLRTLAGLSTGTSHHIHHNDQIDDQARVGFHDERGQPTGKQTNNNSSEIVEK